ncbi:hypothetical protein OUZ56_029940 [Daphnia magna]|uniref:Uncharacterized protein n=1 Tax=Daphnia magna TaxID=35525 RepID=A0ABR0B8B6_9CRUS|nr:hypothetical protein OUZ56_029940 [Daphnia magna]
MNDFCFNHSAQPQLVVTRGSLSYDRVRSQPMNSSASLYFQSGLLKTFHRPLGWIPVRWRYQIRIRIESAIIGENGFCSIHQIEWSSSRAFMSAGVVSKRYER